MLRHILLSLAMAASLPAAHAAQRIILVGDSTVASGGGYGDYLCRRQRPDTTCLNLAKNGRSSSSYRAEGRWDQVLAHLRDSAAFDKTYVLVQFGHNDQPGKPGRSTDLVKEYPANLARYVADVKAAGGVPVLVTSLTRRSFRNGYVWNDLAPWAAAVREVGQREGAAVLDLNTLSLAAVQAMGPDEADTLAQPKGLGFDYTHLGPKGGRLFGDMAARELLRLFPALGPLTDPADTSRQAAREHAPADGWAGMEGGTQGGASAAASAVHTVGTRGELLAALAPAAAAAPDHARIIQVRGTIDMADGAKPGVVRLPSHTTLIGLGEDAGFGNASIVVANASQVIIRNLTISNPCDPEPKWDPQDGPNGNWNSQFDGITVTGSHHVWIDHNSFTDAPRTDGQAPKENGMMKQCHDGALDITAASDFVTVSNNHFALHEKNTLVGGSDRATGDDGHLRVTFANNFFDHVAARALRPGAFAEQLPQGLAQAPRVPARLQRRHRQAGARHRRRQCLRYRGRARMRRRAAQSGRIGTGSGARPRLAAKRQSAGGMRLLARRRLDRSLCLHRPASRRRAAQRHEQRRRRAPGQTPRAVTLSRWRSTSQVFRWYDALGLALGGSQGVCIRRITQAKCRRPIGVARKLHKDYFPSVAHIAEARRYKLVWRKALRSVNQFAAHDFGVMCTCAAGNAQACSIRQEHCFPKVPRGCGRNVLTVQPFTNGPVGQLRRINIARVLSLVIQQGAHGGEAYRQRCSQVHTEIS
jgi:pectate lyase/lysophospholipase L1-like esterase